MHLTASFSLGTNALLEKRFYSLLDYKVTKPKNRGEEVSETNTIFGEAIEAEEENLVGKERGVLRKVRGES